jgi:hypothetical protein
MSHRFVAALVAGSCVLSACGREDPTAPAPVRGESIAINASVPASSIANSGSDAADYPFRRDIQLSIRQTDGFDRTVAVTVLNRTLFPMGSEASSRSRIKVALPVDALVLPADGSLSIATPLFHSDGLRGVTVDLGYTVILAGADGLARHFPVTLL